MIQVELRAYVKAFRLKKNIIFTDVKESVLGSREETEAQDEEEAFSKSYRSCQTILRRQALSLHFVKTLMNFEQETEIWSDSLLEISLLLQCRKCCKDVHLSD